MHKVSVLFDNDCFFLERKNGVIGFDRDTELHFLTDFCGVLYVKENRAVVGMSQLL